RVDNGIARWQLDFVGAVVVLDDKLTALVLIGLGEKKRGGHVGTHASLAIGVQMQGAVDMVAVSAAALITIEARRQYPGRQSGGHEQGMPLQGRRDARAKLLTYHRIGR